LTLKSWGVKGFKNIRYYRKDKGQVNCVNQFLRAISQGNFEPIPRSQIFNVQKFLIEASQ